MTILWLVEGDVKLMFLIVVAIFLHSLLFVGYVQLWFLISTTPAAG
jgi:hypothetical protein